MTQNPIQQRFQAAFDSFLAKVRQDPAIIAVYIYGSLVRGDMWEGSDMDVYVVTRDERAPRKVAILIEDEITFHCDVVPRSQFRHHHERMLRGSVSHQIFTSGKLVYTTDESLREYYDDLAYVGERDREMLALYYASAVVGSLHSVNKSLHAHQDATYMFFWLVQAVRHLACVEVALRGEIIQRESLHQAVRLNPDDFQPIVRELLHGDKTLDVLQGVQARVETYLQERAEIVFKSLLDYLAGEGEVRGISDIARHLTNRMGGQTDHMQFFGTCDWLVDVGLLERVVNPVKLTPKSRTTVDEPAYFYGGL